LLAVDKFDLGWFVIALGELDSLHGEALLGQSLEPIVGFLGVGWNVLVFIGISPVLLPVINAAQAVACRLLGKFGDSTAARVLQLETTKNEDATIRAVAAQALAQIAARGGMAPSTERKQSSGGDWEPTVHADEESEIAKTN
jgi:hypothetical protein